MSLAQRLRPHLAGIVIVLALAASLAAPRWWLLATEPGEGARVQVDPGGAYGIGWDEALYAPIIRQAYDGQIPPRDSYLAERDGDPPLTFAWWPALIGTAGHVTGGMFVALALAHSLAIALAMLLLYALALRLTGSRLAAVATPPIAILVAQVLYQAQGFWALRNWDVLQPLLAVDPPGEFHTWFRFLAPSMALGASFGAMLAMRQAVETRRRSWQVACAAAVALLIYTNPFFWTALLLGIALWTGTLALDRNWTSFRDVVLIVGAAVILALPEVAIIVWNALDVPRSVQERAGLGAPGLETEFGGIIAQRLLLLAPLSWLALRGPRLNRLWVALAASPLLLALTSGLVPQADHYLYQAWLPLALPLFLAAAREAWAAMAERWRRAGAVALAVIGAASFLYAVAFQIQATRALDQDYAVRTSEGDALTWIRANLGEDDVVVTPSRSTNYLLTALTPVYVYVPYGSSAVGTRASEDEIMDRYFRASAAFGYAVDDTMYRLDPANGIPRPERDSEIPPADIERYVERSMIDYLLNELVDRPDDVRARLPAWEATYRAVLEEVSPLSPYRATYLYCGPRERLWQGADSSAEELVVLAFQNDEVALYRLASPADTGAMEFGGCSRDRSVKYANP